MGMQTRSKNKLINFGKRAYGAYQAARPGIRLIQGLRNQYRGSGSQTETKRRRTTQSADTTDQYDRSVRYVRRRMPRYKRKRWVSFSRKVQHVALQMNPLRIYQNNFKGLNAGADGTQSSNGALLYDEFTNHLDVSNIFKDAYGGSGVPGGYTSNRIYLKSATMDVQFTADAGLAAIIDVYHVRMRRGTVGSFASLQTFWDNCFAQLAAVGSVSNTNVANTPFSCPAFCKTFLVMKKTQYLVDEGNVVTVQMRMPRNGYIMGRNLEQTFSGQPGWTQGFFWQIRGIPGNTAGDEVTGVLGHAVRWSVQKNYTYALPPGASAPEIIGQTK